MKIRVSFSYNMFDMELRDWQISLLKSIDWKNPVNAIIELANAGISLSSILPSSYHTGAVLNIATHVTKLVRVTASLGMNHPSKDFGTDVMAAIMYLTGKTSVSSNDFREGRIYRFVYKGGTKPNEKRLVKVTGVFSTYMDGEANEGARRYSYDKITDVEEV